MLKRLAVLGLLAAAPAHAETISSEIAATGLAATEARLAALATRSEDETLALGAVQFLRAIEGTFQTRWAYGMTDRSGMVPLLRLPLDDNPGAKPFDPPGVAQIFREAEAGLAKAITTFSTLPDASTAALELNLGDVWFDVNGNAARDAGEELAAIVGTVSMGISPAEVGMEPPPLPTIRFDIADTAWATAYAHLLSGVAETVLAYDPTEPLSRVIGARMAMAEYGPPPPSFLTGMDRMPDEIDLIAMVLATLDQTPDAARTAAAHGHFLNMIAQNKRFWALAEAETDNTQEWLPNARQSSGLGVALPPETGARWQAVLADAEAVLKGEKLIPYWRMGDAGGVNLQKLFLEPGPQDVAGWIQGWSAVPYLEKGPLVSAES
ncbi:MAG: hypothetical protein E6Q73_05305 [Pseudorhodobacter sp.]|nr:MAG: hypothetical protein E6Q73_05305 [Pseudorhodobacter sp.]